MKQEYYQQTLDPYKPKLILNMKLVFDGDVIKETGYYREVEDVIEYNMYESIIEDTIGGKNDRNIHS